MPETLLLKLRKSLLCNWPLLTMEAVGRLSTKALVVPVVEVLILKALPALPTETLLMILLGLLMTKALVEVER